MAALVLVGAMGLALIACSKKAKEISSRTFRKIMTEEGYRIEDFTFDSNEDCFAAISEDEDIVVEYMLLEDRDHAKAEYQLIYNKLAKAERDGKFEGTIKSKNGKATANGTFEGQGYYDGDMYVVVLISGEMVLHAYSFGNDEAVVEEVDRIVKKLCY